MRALLCWGTTVGHHHLVSSPLVHGENRVQMPPLGDECARGCDVSVTLIAAADPKRKSPVAASPLLDLSGPMLARYTVSLEVIPPPGRFA